MKYFCISDIHGFGGYLERDLKKAGFQKTNKDHMLIVCGDIFDRGPDNLGVYNYIKSIPKSRRILIKGNHEQLYFDLLKKDIPERHDFTNGTVNTFCEIAGYDYSLDYYDTCFDKTNFIIEWKDIKEKVAKSKITKWLKSKEWKDYYELDNYIFVHSFIPVRVKDIPETMLFRYYPTYHIPSKFLEPIPDWRTNASQLDWEDSRWVCPWELFKDGLFDKEKQNGKILVCGHWHSSDFFKGLDNEEHDIYDGEMYNNHGIIGLDACSVLSKKINVLEIAK